MKKNFFLIALIMCYVYILIDNYAISLQSKMISIQSERISIQSERIHDLQSEQENLRKELSSSKDEINLLQNNVDDLQKQVDQLFAAPVEDMFRARMKSEDDDFHIYYYDIDEEMAENYTSPILMDGYCNHSLWIYGISIRSIRICSLTNNNLKVIASPAINSSYFINYDENEGYYHILLWDFEDYFENGIVIEITSFNNRKYYISCRNKGVS